MPCVGGTCRFIDVSFDVYNVFLEKSQVTRKCGPMQGTDFFFRPTGACRRIDADHSECLPTSAPRSQSSQSDRREQAD